ncbi:MAG: DUF3592 domain-containing protein [Anaerolineales bacterium]|nr:DUF3592 domain-containing protein [Anaerolineales bacterium]
MSGDNVPYIFGLICGGFFILIIGGLGVFLIVYSVRSRKKAEASQTWPSATGRITEAEIKESTSTDDDDVTRVTYYPAVRYEYQVDDQVYTGKRISFGGIVSSSSRSKAETELARYPVDGEVTVYYNPEKPEEAVLEQKASGSKMGLVFGVVCLSIAGCITCFLLVGLANALVNGF